MDDLLPLGAWWTSELSVQSWLSSSTGSCFTQKEEAMTVPRGTSERPGWNEYYLGIAQAASARGDCIRRKVGAVLVTENHDTYMGYNGSKPGGPSCLAGECERCLDDSIPSGSGYENCIEIHAEINVLRRTPWREGVRATMYISCAPCVGCQNEMEARLLDRAVWPGGEMEF